MSEESTVRVAVHGAGGRMGRRLCALATEMAGVELVEAVEAPGHEAIGRPAAENADIAITDAPTGRAQVAIDFTTPAAMRSTLEWCAANGIALVIGTTGLSDAEEAAIDQAATRVPVVQAANFSLVVNVLNVLASRAARMLGESYDIEILEAHHRYKKDAPSGTALALARAICEATGRSFERDVVFTRHGAETTRRSGEITVQALRLGDVVGEHTVYFGAPGERMELRHVGGSRDSYAGGAIHAARWLIHENKSAGRYSMRDVLGLE